MDTDVVKKEEDSAEEEDMYEDAGDLDFSCVFESIYLTRLPKYLWKAWLQSENEQEVHIGTLRIEGSLEKPKRVSDISAQNTVLTAHIYYADELNVIERRSSQ